MNDIINFDMISDSDWRQIALYAEHNELTIDYVLEEFVVDGVFTPSDMVSD